MMKSAMPMTHSFVVVLTFAALVNKSAIGISQQRLSSALPAMKISKVRGILYNAARFLGDIDAVLKGRVWQRIFRRLAGRWSARLMGRWFR